MAVSFTNAWKVSVEEGIQDAIKNEFSAALPIFRTPDFKFRGNHFMTITGENSFSDETMIRAIPERYNLDLNYYHLDRKRTDLSLKHFFSQVSRIEEILYSLLEAIDLYDIQIVSIVYDEDEKGFRKALFNIEVSKVR
tara:strand:- start:4419 stop:4832 length:414 start_codon:yes stop_codon:yes gene_type:complete